MVYVCSLALGGGGSGPLRYAPMYLGRPSLKMRPGGPKGLAF